MNEELRDVIIEYLGLKWCAVINNYVHRDCFNHCSDCIANIELEMYYSLEFDERDEPFENLK